MDTTREKINKFWELQEAGKSVELDIDLLTGEVSVRCSENAKTGADGDGTPGIPVTDNWERVIVCDKGAVSKP
jgi:hypothetical protein